MKNTILKALAVMLVALSLTACSDDDAKTDKAVKTTVSTEQTTLTTTSPTETTTETPTTVVTTTTPEETTISEVTTTPQTSETKSETETSITTQKETTTTKKPTTVTTTTTKKKATTTTTTANKTTTTTTTKKKTTTTTTTKASNSNDLPDGYKYKFTEKDIEELKQLCKDYAISRGVTWDETKTRANSSWCGDCGFFEYNLFFDMNDAKEKVKESVDYWVDGLGTNGQQKFTTLGLEVVVEYDEYRNYPKYWQFYILT